MFFKRSILYDHARVATSGSNKQRAEPASLHLRSGSFVKRVFSGYAALRVQVDLNRGEPVSTPVR
jgi:hypothetical protein